MSAQSRIIGRVGLVKVEIHLSGKNSLYVFAGAAMLAEAVIPFVVSAERLKTLVWHAILLLIAVAGVISLVVQACLQSREDHEREAKEKERDERSKRLDSFLEKYAPASPLQIEPPVVTAFVPEDELYIELYQPTFVYPKVGDLAFKLLQGKYAASGRKEEDAVTDCDLIVELYIVNKSTKKIYIRDFAAWVEIAGEWQKLDLDDNFDVDDLWSGSVEYGLEPKDGGTKEPSQLPRLLAKRNTEIEPGEPIEGWLKFTVPGINPTRQYALRLAVIDSTGKEHYVDKAVKKERNIALRRISR